MSVQQWTNLKNKLGRKVKWNVRIQNQYKHGNGVLTYLARYIKGGPISNGRLLSIDNDTVSFRYRVNGEGGQKNRSDIMKLSVAEFIDRFMQHVPEKRTRVVRAWGLYSPAMKTELDRCRQFFGQLPVEKPEFLNRQEAFSKQNIDSPAVCPECGQKLVTLEEICPVRGIIKRQPSDFIHDCVLLRIRDWHEAYPCENKILQTHINGRQGFPA